MAINVQHLPNFLTAGRIAQKAGEGENKKERQRIDQVDRQIDERIRQFDLTHRFRVDQTNFQNAQQLQNQFMRDQFARDQLRQRALRDRSYLEQQQRAQEQIAQRQLGMEQLRQLGQFNDREHMAKLQKEQMAEGQRLQAADRQAEWEAGTVEVMDEMAKETLSGIRELPLNEEGKRLLSQHEARIRSIRGKRHEYRPHQYAEEMEYALSQLADEELDGESYQIKEPTVDQLMEERVREAPGGIVIWKRNRSTGELEGTYSSVKEQSPAIGGLSAETWDKDYKSAADRLKAKRELALDEGERPKSKFPRIEEAIVEEMRKYNRLKAETLAAEAEAEEAASQIDETAAEAASQIDETAAVEIDPEALPPLEDPDQLSMQDPNLVAEIPDFEGYFRGEDGKIYYKKAGLGVMEITFE